MIIVGIDDTDVVGSRGTNQLAKQIVRELAGQWRCVRIVRHQLLNDPRVPCTTKNGSASITLELRNKRSDSLDIGTAERVESAPLLNCCREVMRDWFIEGSDPGLCLLAGTCPPEVVEWGQRCQHEFVARRNAFALAADTGLILEALGGTEDGVIGALAAVGLSSTENDGRIVQLGEWPDDLSGPQPVDVLSERGVRVRELNTGREFTQGTVDVGKHLRPNLRNGMSVLFVESPDAPDSPTQTNSQMGQDVLRAIRLT